MSERSSFYLIEHAAKAFIISDGRVSRQCWSLQPLGSAKMFEYLEQAR